MSEHLALWERNFKTDPAHCTKFTRAGGFSGTAIRPYYLAQRLTEEFGACGIGWGFHEVRSEYRAGVWCSYVEFWYELNGQRASIFQWGQTTMEGSRKDGSVFVTEEAPKMAITDGWTKCASLIGFGGDVHMGLFDSKYVHDTESAATSKQGKLAGNNPDHAPKQANQSPTSADIDRNDPFWWEKVEIHFGQNKGTRLDKLTSKQLQWYHDEWCPKKRLDAKYPPRAADLLVMEALQAWYTWDQTDKQPDTATQALEVF